MDTGWRVLSALFLLFFSCPATPHQQEALHFSQSLRLTRRTRAQVQHLLHQYNEQHFGSREYEDRSLALKTLPSFNMDYFQWKSVPDRERLSAASKYLQTFWAHLDTTRRQMEIFWRGRTDRQKAMHLVQATSDIQRHLKTLITNVNSQLQVLNSISIPQVPSSHAPQALTPTTQILSPLDPWSSCKLGYVVLRDLDRYLARLARDFTFLRAKHKGRSAASKHRHTS